MRELEAHHMAWLAKHSERTEEWLRMMLSAGFHVHHVDHDHGNNSHENLVLMDGVDHMALHGRNLRQEVIEGREAKRSSHVSLGEEAYHRKSPEESWSAIGRDLWPGSLQPQAVARAAAKSFADANGLAFPKPGAASPTYGRAA